MEELLIFVIGGLCGILMAIIWSVERSRRTMTDDFLIRKARLWRQWEEEKLKKLQEEYKVFDEWDRRESAQNQQDHDNAHQDHASDAGKTRWAND